MGKIRSAVVRARSWLGRQNTLDSYVTSAPEPQLALDIFAGEWASRMPPPLDGTRAGSAALFDDERIRWAGEQLGGFEGKTVLDLGPLEGGHPYMFEKMGASEIVAIEANTRAFLKCLVTKELLGLRRVSYSCGDFVEYLRENSRRFDVVNASGVLYHLRNPAEMIGLAARISSAIIMWTHYNDETAIAAKPALRRKFPGTTKLQHETFTYDAYRQEYRSSTYLPGFCGGSASYSHWMSRPAILACLEAFGFSNTRIAFDTPQHVNGPSFLVVATK